MAGVKHNSSTESHSGKNQKGKRTLEDLITSIRSVRGWGQRPDAILEGEGERGLKSNGEVPAERAGKLWYRRNRK